ncbi:hypothetical protein JQ594_00610 [Bradyrhizobium manausense]|uniref:hypothetical protein n=1 Tax=Bradyrhizobium manausense TaxID=989370 RepID=UPI001BACBFAF|nr:hypothetical protein [Bradyrhizobium manausense]MBR0684404.1 hypothetical protein [Bradyrhizobium manausense]
MHLKDSSYPYARQTSASRSNARSSFLERARRNVAAQVLFPHPLSWWRTRRPENFKEVDIYIARHLLTKSAIIGEPHWHLGAAGNGPIAINVAWRANKRCGASLVSVDVAMTAVLCIALEGNVEAKLFLAAILQQRSDVDHTCGALSDSWLDFTPPWA